MNGENLNKQNPDENSIERTTNCFEYEKKLLKQTKKDFLSNVQRETESDANKNGNFLFKHKISQNFLRISMKKEKKTNFLEFSTKKLRKISFSKYCPRDKLHKSQSNCSSN